MSELGPIRKWAQAHGFPVAARGRLPLEVIEAYKVAHHIGPHVGPPRWKLICINADRPVAPHAMTYLRTEDGIFMHRYHKTWDHAVAWLEREAS